jgi:hypothetical protein
VTFVSLDDGAPYLCRKSSSRQRNARRRTLLPWSTETGPERAEAEHTPTRRLTIAPLLPERNARLAKKSVVRGVMGGRSLTGTPRFFNLRAQPLRATVVDAGREKTWNCLRKEKGQRQVLVSELSVLQGRDRRIECVDGGHGRERAKASMCCS